MNRDKRKKIAKAIWKCKFMRRYLSGFYYWLGDIILWGKYKGKESALGNALSHGGALHTIKRKRKVTLKFFIFVAILLGLSILSIYMLVSNYALVLDKVIEILSREKVTSPYWKMVFKN